MVNRIVEGRRREAAANPPVGFSMGRTAAGHLPSHRVLAEKETGNEACDGQQKVATATDRQGIPEPQKLDQNESGDGPRPTQQPSRWRNRAN